MESAAEDLSKIPAEARSFRNQFKSLYLSTASTNGIPTASYAPFVQLSELQFGIYISELAAHTQNLLNNPIASVLFIEAEDYATQLFARKRLVYSCDAILHARDGEIFQTAMEAFKQRFPAIMTQLEKMKDFHMFTLDVTRASYVTGFAEAYEFKASKPSNSVG